MVNGAEKDSQKCGCTNIYVQVALEDEGIPAI